VVGRGRGKSGRIQGARAGRRQPLRYLSQHPAHGGEHRRAAVFFFCSLPLSLLTLVRNISRSQADFSADLRQKIEVRRNMPKSYLLLQKSHH
jgi:hypothetical protein